MPIGVMLTLVCGRFAGVETWYSRNAGDVSAGVAAGRLLAEARAACLSSNCYVQGFRVFNTAVKFDVRNISLSDPVNEGALGITGQLPAAAASLADVQTTSLLAKVYGSTGGRARTGNRELFGVPDNVCATTPLGQRVYTPTANFLKGLAKYNAEILGSWSFRVLAITPRHGITGLVVDSAPPGLLGLRADLGGDALIAAGKRVRVRGSIRQTTMLRLNGLWTVSRVDAPVAPSTLSTVYLIGSSGYDANGYDPLGTVEGLDYAYCPAAEYQVIRPMGRKRGGSSGLPRGRSLARSR